MSANQQQPKRAGNKPARRSNGRNGPPGAGEGNLGQSSGGVAASGAATGNAPQCGWLGAIFGQCCKGEPVEHEVRVAGPEDGAPRGRPTRASEEVTPSGGQLGLQRPPAAVARYRIDNSILQIPNRPGVAYRYTKSEADKVKNEAGPAKWDEIVEGIDEGDGWLKVGQYYLPMTYKSTPVITPVQDSAQARPKRRGDAVAGSPSPTAAAGPVQGRSPGQAAMAQAPGAPSAPRGASPQGPPLRVESPKGSDSTPGQRQSPQRTTPTSPAAKASSPAKDLQAQQQMETQRRLEQQQQLHEQQLQRQKLEQQKLEQQKVEQQKFEQHKLEDSTPPAREVLEEPVKVQAKHIEVDELKKPQELTPAEPWFLQPSIGTWLHAAPAARGQGELFAVAKVLDEGTDMTKPLMEECPLASVCLLVGMLATVRATGVTDAIKKTNGHAFKVAGKWYLGEELEAALGASAAAKVVEGFPAAWPEPVKP